MSNQDPQQQRFSERRAEHADEQLTKQLIPMLISVFKLPDTIVLRKFEHFDVFAVHETPHEKSRKLGELRKPAGFPVYSYYPDVPVSFWARLRARLRTLWALLTRERVKLFNETNTKGKTS